MPKNLLLYSPPPGTNVFPVVARKPNPAELPPYVDAANALAIVVKYYFPETAPGLAGWSGLTWWLIGRTKICRTARLLEEAQAKLDAARVISSVHWPPERQRSALPAARPRPGEPAPRAAARRRRVAAIAA
jgi:hypothetical protein